MGCASCRCMTVFLHDRVVNEVQFLDPALPTRLRNVRVGASAVFVFSVGRQCGLVESQQRCGGPSGHVVWLAGALCAVRAQRSRQGTRAFVREWQSTIGAIATWSGTGVEKRAGQFALQRLSEPFDPAPSAK